MQRERSTKAERIRSVLSPTPMSPPGAGSTHLQGGQTQDPYAKAGLRGEYRRINGAQLAQPHAALLREQREEQARQQQQQEAAALRRQLQEQEQQQERQQQQQQEAVALRRQQQEEQARHIDLALRSIDEAAQSTPNLARTLVRTQSQAQRERERRLQAEEASEARRAEIDQMSAELARVEMEIRRLGGSQLGGRVISRGRSRGRPDF
jgi:hypothetical protein